MPDKQYVLACDIGGTHITAAVINIENWEIQEDTISRHYVDSGADTKTIFQHWAAGINDSLSKATVPVTRIGVAMPGPFDYTNGIALMTGQSKYDSLYGIAVTEPLLREIAYPIDDVLYINDAAAFLQGEVFKQGLQNEQRILGITLGTGLGSAVWSIGEKAFDADLWDSPYKNSVFEEHLVTRWFTKRFLELTGLQEKGLKEILEKHGDRSETHQLLAQYAEHLYDFKRFFSQKYGATKFIVGGNITKAWDKLQTMDGNLHQEFDITIGKYPEFAAIIGAASLFADH